MAYETIMLGARQRPSTTHADHLMVDRRTEAVSTSFKVFSLSIDYSGVTTYFTLPSVCWLISPVGDGFRRSSSDQPNSRGPLPGAQYIRPEAVSTSFKVFSLSIDYSGANTYFLLPAMW